MDSDDEHPPPWRYSQYITFLEQTDYTVWESCFNKAIKKKRGGRWKPWLDISACQELSWCEWYLCFRGEIARIYIRHENARPKRKGSSPSWSRKAGPQNEGSDCWTLRMIFISNTHHRGWMLAPQTVEDRRNSRLLRAVGRPEVMTILCNISSWSWRGLILMRACFSALTNKLPFTSWCQEWGKGEE